MRAVAVVVEEIWGELPRRAEKVMQQMNLLPFNRHTCILFFLIFLAFGGGWFGGQWATRLPQLQGTSPTSQPGVLPTPREEVLSFPRESVPRQEEKSPGARAYLGIRGKELSQGAVRGVRITEVFPGSPAAKAGLRSDRDPAPAYLRQPARDTGHILVGANGEAVRSEEELGRLLEQGAPGSTVKFLVTSSEGNFYEVIPVTLGPIPQTFSVAAVTTGERVRTSSLEETAEQGVEGEILREINRIREEKDLPPLRRNPELQKVARRYSEDMATRHFFAHVSPDGRHVVDRLREEGIADFTAAGENIFTGEHVTNLAAATVREWRKNASHRQNLLNPRYAEAGTGIAWAGEDVVYITQVFLER